MRSATFFTMMPSISGKALRRFLDQAPAKARIHELNRTVGTHRSIWAIGLEDAYTCIQPYENSRPLIKVRSRGPPAKTSCTATLRSRLTITPFVLSVAATIAPSRSWVSGFMTRHAPATWLHLRSPWTFCAPATRRTRRKKKRAQATFS